MDKEVQGESSSSPRDSICILKIGERGINGEIYKVYLTGGSSFFILARDFDAFHLGVGSSLSGEVLEGLRNAAEYLEVRQKALQLINLSEHSTFQIMTKVIKKGYRRDISEKVLKDLQGEGIVDDRRFAGMWVESRIRNHPEGIPRLIAGLRRKGVSASLSEEVVLSKVNGDVLLEMLERSAQKLCRKTEISRAKLKKRLFFLGFPSVMVKNFIECGMENIFENKC